MNRQISTFLNKILDSCTQCGKCQEECLFLKEFDVAPWKFAESLIRTEQEEEERDEQSTAELAHVTNS